MSASCPGVMAVMVLFAETTGTTSSARPSRATASNGSTTSRLAATLKFMAASSEHEVQRRAEDARAAAAFESGLDAAERAGRSCPHVHDVVLQFEGGVAPEIPAHTERQGVLDRRERELLVQRRVQLRRDGYERRGNLARQREAGMRAIAVGTQARVGRVGRPGAPDRKSVV